MRVAVFTDNDFNKINGVTTTLTALLDHVPGDVQPRIYTAAGLGTDTPDYLAIASVGVPIPFYGEMRMYVPKWRTYLQRVRADHVDLLHVTTPGPLGLTALWLAKETGLPLIGSFHTNLDAYTSVLTGSSRLGRWMNEYMLWLYRRCRHVLVPSVATLATLMQRGFPRERLTIWPRGVDADLFTPAKRSLPLRRRWAADEDHPVLLYVGRVSREKGLGLFPSMLERLLAGGLRCRLVIAGDGPLRRELALQCPDAIFMGPLGREQVADVFASADLFVFPSRTDTAGNVVLEAQAAGLPVLVSEAGGPRENIISGVTGVVCNGADGSSWATAVARLLTQPGQRQAMAVAARRYALSRRWVLALQPLFETYRCVDRLRNSQTDLVNHAA